MDIDKAIQNIQIDRMSGDLTDEQADKAIEKLLEQKKDHVDCPRCLAEHHKNTICFNCGYGYYENED